MNLESLRSAALALSAIALQIGLTGCHSQITKAVHAGDSAGLTTLLATPQTPGTLSIPLRASVMYTNVDAARQLLKAGANPDETDGTLRSNPLVLTAAAEGKWDIVSLMLDSGTNPDSHNGKGTTIAHFAAKSGADAVLTRLLERRANFNAIEAPNYTPLSIAVQNNQAGAAKVLLSGGSDPNCKLPSSTCLIEAVGKKNVEMVDALVAAGARDDFSTATGDRAIHYAIGTKNEQIVSLLLKGANNSVNVENLEGISPLAFAVQTSSPRIVELLLVAGANPNIHAMRQKFPVLGEAVANSMIDDSITKALIKAGAATDGPDFSSVTFAHAFALRQSRSLDDFLMSVPFPLNNTNKGGASALALAFLKGNYGAARVLLAKGADPFVGKPVDNSALGYCTFAAPNPDACMDVLRDNNAWATATSNNGVQVSVSALSNAADVSPSASMLMGTICEFGLDGQPADLSAADNYYARAVALGWGNTVALRARVLHKLGQDYAAREAVQAEAQKGFSVAVKWLTDRNYPVPPVATATPQQSDESSGSSSWADLLGLALMAYNSGTQAALAQRRARQPRATATTPPLRTSPSQVLPSSTGCTSDYSCGIGKQCVKAPLAMTGTCLATVNQYGNREYSQPRPGSIGITSTGSCIFSTDCPVGFTCDAALKACVKH